MSEERRPEPSTASRIILNSVCQKTHKPAKKPINLSHIDDKKFTSNITWFSALINDRPSFLDKLLDSPTSRRSYKKRTQNKNFDVEKVDTPITITTARV